MIPAQIEAQTMSPSRIPAFRRAGPLAVAVLATLMMAGCRKGDLVTGTVYPEDYRQRHPIALQDANTQLDIFVGRNRVGLDERQLRDLRDFAADFKQNGRGPIMMIVPSNTRTPAATHRGAQAVRSALSQAGIGNAYVRTSTYPGADDELASPVRLTFTKLHAKVTSRCGDFTQDVGGLNMADSWSNLPPRNFGCAYQSMIANQVADPLDLQRARAEDRADVQRRMQVFDTARKGQDPSTTWKTGTASANGGGQ